MDPDWRVQYRRPPDSHVQSAKADIPSVMAGLKFDAERQVSVAIPELIRLLSSKHSLPASEWAIHDAITAGELTPLAVEQPVVLPGPTDTTVRIKPESIPVAGVRSTEALWRNWHAEAAVALPSAAQSRSEFDVGIFVALKDEFRELHKEIEGTCDLAKDAESNFHFYTFNRPGPGHTQYRCVATFAGEMGETRAADAMRVMISLYSPTTLVVVGIAGALSDDLRLGDVVVARTVISYAQNNKVIDTKGGDGWQLVPSGAPFRTSAPLLKSVEHMEFAHAAEYGKWRLDGGKDLQTSIDIALLAAHNLTNCTRQEPTHIEGTIASGPFVVISASFKQWLFQHVDRKFLAIEMESGGALATAEQGWQHRHSLVIRGISDLGDDNKAKLDAIGNGAFRGLAMRNALRFLWMLLRTGIEPAAAETVGCVTTETNSLSGQAMIQGCTWETKDVSGRSFIDTISTFRDHFSFRWEPESFRGVETVVFWPVRLRHPTPIHAVQCFAAAALALNGAKVVLFLDDLGHKEHSTEAFVHTMRRWFRRVASAAPLFEVRTFSAVVQRDDDATPWEFVRKWLGENSTNYLFEVLHISKILKPHEDERAPLRVLNLKRPRRLLTPPVTWACLATVRSDFENWDILTLGGYDERFLWKAWRSTVADGQGPVGHLYIPNLDDLGATAADQPLHMAETLLAWGSVEDVETALKKDVEDGPTTWTRPSRIIPWSLSGLVALPEFVSGGCQTVRKPTIADTSEPQQLISGVSSAIGRWFF